MSYLCGMTYEDNPNIYSEFKGFTLGDKYSVTESYKNRIDLSDFTHIDTVDEYKIYTSEYPASFYVLSDDFFGLASLIDLD